MPGPRVLHKPDTVQWTRARLKDANPDRAVGILRSWTHPRRHEEASREVIIEINRLTDDAAEIALTEMTRPPTVIGKKSLNRLDVPITITTLDDRKSFDVQALLDSGSTSSCIDEGFVHAKGLTTRKLPRAIPCYNADGLPSATQEITHEVIVRMKIGTHLETIHLRVLSLGSNTIFLGYDWLVRHNPTISWSKSTLVRATLPELRGV